MPKPMNEVMKKYYVYLYVRTSGYSPYYVGKGLAGSYRHLSSYHSVVLPKDRERIKIIKESLTNEEACELERTLIRFWGRQDNGTGVLRNCTDGGEGTPGRKHKESTKRLMSEQKRGKSTWNSGGTCSQEWKDKVSASRKGKGLGNQNARRYPVVVKGVYYPSKKEAALAHGVQFRTLQRRGWVE